MIFTGNLGYPRIGKQRELKFALEKYWNGAISIDTLRNTALAVQEEKVRIHQHFDLDFIPSGDFSFYDHVLDHTIMLNAIPPRFQGLSFQNPEDLLFTMARGGIGKNGELIPAMEMTKWFNTNYHYIVPEINMHTKFALNAEKLVAEVKHARTLGADTRPVILGPVSYLILSKSNQDGFDPISKISELIPIYDELFSVLHHNNVEWVQLDEPAIGSDLSKQEKSAYLQFFSECSVIEIRPKIMLTAYFSDLSNNSGLLTKSPFEGLHIDITESKYIENIISSNTQIEMFSFGVISGRNIWQSDLEANLVTLKSYTDLIPHKDFILSPSCSMLHLPLDKNLEKSLDPSILSWMAFAEQKLEILAMLKKAYLQDPTANEFLDKNKKAIESREASVLVHTLKDSQNLSALPEHVFTRKSPFSARKNIQRNALNLPILPTTTIGSFPQTTEVRKARSKFSKGNLSKKDYNSYLEKEIEDTIRFQEEIGLDVLVHGEFERNDMVQYFAEKLSGFVFTKFGWVQSFGSRCVRPPIIFGDVSRPDPMTVEWTKLAQSKTQKYVKGMLTGPVTILQWSFVRDDQPRSETCKQIALAIRDEVCDLEKAGTQIIQIDEPALREGLPIQKISWNDYLEWAVKCFKLASSGVEDKTQIHTHMCYAEFNDIIDAIINLDADVISVEASRSNMDLLNAFQVNTYPNEIGPGVYDIHSPNIPSTNEMVNLIRKALEVISKENLWINPDCGLKTRKWEEVSPSLTNMVAAAKIVRTQL
jgi:5-methyltetrahydropteroyltriglutamate--homocysteine methyltransferase